MASKYLYDDGEEDEVFNDEWATSAAITLQDLNQAELEFLTAIVSIMTSIILVVSIYSREYHLSIGTVEVSCVNSNCLAQA